MIHFTKCLLPFYKYFQQKYERKPRDLTMLALSLSSVYHIVDCPQVSGKFLSCCLHLSITDGSIVKCLHFDILPDVSCYMILLIVSGDDSVCFIYIDSF